MTSYVVHWGDGDSDTYARAASKTHTYADGPANRTITVDLVDEDGTFLDRANALSVTVNNVAPTIAISGAASVNEGSVYTLTLGAVTDPGTDTVSARSCTGATATATPTHDGVKTHTYADGPDATHHGRPGGRGRHLPGPRERAVGARQQRRASDDRPRSAGAASVNEGSATR